MAPHRSRRLLRIGLAGVLATAFAAVAVPQPAQANTQRLLSPTALAYVDSLHPTTAFPDPADLPVGRTGAHLTRSFVTFDISAYAGHKIVAAAVNGREVAATDCATRSVELWSTSALKSGSTWRNQPSWQRKVDTIGVLPGAPCPTGVVGWNATSALRTAVAAGRKTLTLGLRNTDEKNPALGRRYAATLEMAVTSDIAPDTPVVVGNGGQPCATKKPYPWLNTTRAQSYLTVTATDPDDGVVDVTFAAWPEGKRDQQVTWSLPGGGGSEVRSSLPEALGDGTYGWSARAVDANGQTSAWTRPCYFHRDTVHPAVPPTITVDPASPRAQGIPMTFTFDAAGATDVAGFAYEWTGGQGYVEADRLGGSATAALAPPTSYASLRVAGVDRAGNFSPDVLFATNAVGTTPIVEVEGAPRAGEAAQVNLAPGVHIPGYDRVVSYSYTVNDGPANVVTAAADGTATARVPMAHGQNDIKVTSTSSNGWVSPAWTTYVYAENKPSVASTDWPADGDTGTPAGRTGTFTFTNHMPGATTFTYTFDFSTYYSAPIGPDGTATVTWTPETSGAYGFFVYSEMPDGTQSDWETYNFTVSLATR